MLPRSLLVPPGIPEFMTRERLVPAGEVLVEGRAWSGLAPVASVEVSADGGSSWATAELEPEEGPWAWPGRSFRWRPDPGASRPRSPARDQARNDEPLDPAPNLAAHATNSVPPLPV